MPEIDVFLVEAHVGALAADADGRLTFAYDGTTAPALSLSLPPRIESYADAACRPFFAGLLPEGSALQRAAESRRLQVYETFRLLEAFGGECAGAVRLLPSGTVPSIPRQYEALDENSLAEALDEIDRAPNFARDRRVRLSVAGVQGKTAVRVTDSGLAKPLGGSPSTHILKVGNDRFPTLPQNEAFCLRLASALGLAAARAELRRAGGRHFLLVERYDRVVSGGDVRERHQEDFCQALGFMPERKYEIDEATGAKIGPGFKECFDLLDGTRAPAVDRGELLRRLLFNFLIANADAHAKNLSLIYDDSAIARPRLAPAYDLVSTRIYPQLTDAFAMSHGGARNPEATTRATWDRLAREVGIAPRTLRDEAARLSREIVPACRRLMDREFTHHAPFAHILSAIGERVRHLSDAFGLGLDVDTPPLVLQAPGWGHLGS